MIKPPILLEVSRIISKLFVKNIIWIQMEIQAGKGNNLIISKVI